MGHTNDTLGAFNFRHHRIMLLVKLPPPSVFPYWYEPAVNGDWPELVVLTFRSSYLLHKKKKTLQYERRKKGEEIKTVSTRGEPWSRPRFKLFERRDDTVHSVSSDPNFPPLPQGRIHPDYEREDWNFPFFAFQQETQVLPPDALILD
jgi:hypothetical protein